MESLLWFLANPIEADNDEHKAIFDRLSLAVLAR